MEIRQPFEEDKHDIALYDVSPSQSKQSSNSKNLSKLSNESINNSVKNKMARRSDGKINQISSEIFINKDTGYNSDTRGNKPTR